MKVTAEQKKRVFEPIKIEIVIEDEFELNKLNQEYDTLQKYVPGILLPRDSINSDSNLSLILHRVMQAVKFVNKQNTER